MKRLLIGLAAVAAVSGPAYAAETELCPASIETQQSVKSAPYPFRAVAVARVSQLMGLTFFDGDPKDEASLAPDDEVKSGGKIVSTWSFPPGNARGTYLQCAFTDTTIVLQRKLEAAITKCAVTYDAHEEVGGLPAILKIDCK